MKNNTENPVEPTKAQTVAQSEATENITAPVADADVEQYQAQIADLTNDLQRTRADFENFRKQVEAQKALTAAATKDATVAKFLPLVDDVFLALQTYPEQLAPLTKSLEKTLSGLGLALIDSAPEVEFNPDFHEAISVEEGDGDTEVIAETLRPGYTYDGSVIRPAMVKVKRI